MYFDFPASESYLLTMKNGKVFPRELTEEMVKAKIFAYHAFDDVTEHLCFEDKSSRCWTFTISFPSDPSEVKDIKVFLDDLCIDLHIEVKSSTPPPPPPALCEFEIIVKHENLPIPDRITPEAVIESFNDQFQGSELKTMPDRRLYVGGRQHWEFVLESIDDNAVGKSFTIYGCDFLLTTSFKPVTPPDDLFFPIRFTLREGRTFTATDMPKWFSGLKEVMSSSIKWDKWDTELQNVSGFDSFRQEGEGAPFCDFNIDKCSRLYLEYFSETSTRDVSQFSVSLRDPSGPFIFGLSPCSTKSTKTVIMVDVTGSMTSVLLQVKQVVKGIFERASLFLKAVPFQVKIVCYSNYNVAADELLVVSGWEMDPRRLISFLDDVGVRGGWGNEAIEVGFEHVRNCLVKQTPLTKLF